jgi:hypothetical protein
MKSANKIEKPADDKNISKKNSSADTHTELKTDFPLSEKDEVKKAEKNLKESQKKNG